MDPLPTIADAASLPNSNCTTRATDPCVDNPPFIVDDLLEPSSNLDHNMLLDTIPINTSTMDDYWLAPYTTQHTVITIDDDGNTQMECPPLYQSLNEGPMGFNRDTTLSPAAGSNLPVFKCREISSSVPADVNNLSFSQFPPGVTGVSSFPAHDQLSPSPIVNSGNTVLYKTVSSSMSIPRPHPHEPNVAMVTASPPPQNLDATASQTHLNLGAGASLLQQRYHESARCAEQAAWAVGGEANQNDVSMVSFLVKNGTLSIDDGYIWRKYGQKSIKDKSHPRAYFKCAQPNCPVKKQIEISSDVQASVLITYINRHNHGQQSA